MSVIGIDIGYQTCFVAVARQGGIETIDNECSDRCTPNCVSMGEKSRFLGTSAKNQIITNIKNTIWGWKQLIGRKYNDPAIQEDLKALPVEIVENSNGTIGFRVSYLGEPHIFTPEQINAMMLTKLKEISEVALKAKVVDCVINVPCYFTNIQRRALLDAAQVVGLNVLRLMNDTAATALNYGIYKQDLPAPEEKPRNVVFIDIGHSDTQLSVCAFNKGKLTVLATAHDAHLGGLTFDRLIADNFCEDFKARYKIDVASSPKAYLRLLQECERLKKLMSANSQELPFSMECFMNDKDVSSKMSRATMEKLAEPVLKKLEQLMKSLLDSIKMKPDDIYSIEIVGGSSRIPAVKELVKKVYGKDVSTTLNGDEAVARGCALQCAILSPSFRVRDFTVQDAQPYPIVLSWQGGMDDDEGNSMEICSKFHTFPFLKQLTFYRKERFELEARYNSPDIPPNNSAIGTFAVDKVVPQPTGESSKIKVKVRINLHGIFSVSSASMTEKIEANEAEEQQQQPMEVDGVTENGVEEKAGKNSKGGKKQKGGAKGSPPAPAEAGGEENAVNNEEGVKDENGEEKKEKEQEEVINGDKKSASKKQKLKVIDLPVEQYVPRMTKEEINRLMEREGEMIMQDKQEKERMDAKNAVEEYVYEMRKKISGDMEQFMLEKDRTEFLAQLEETENWLYEEGEDLQRQAYVERLSALKKLGGPVADRYREAMERPGMFEQLGQAVQLITKVIDAFDNKDEKYDHLDAADMEKVKKAVAEKREWFEKHMNLFSQHEPHLPPPVTVVQIKSQRESLISTCNPIVNKPKPKPKVEPPPEEKPKEEENIPNGPKAENKDDEVDGAQQQEGEGEGSKVDMDLD